MDGFAWHRSGMGSAFTIRCQMWCNLTRTKIPKRFTFRRLVNRCSHSSWASQQKLPLLTKVKSLHSWKETAACKNG